MMNTMFLNRLRKSRVLSKAGAMLVVMGMLLPNMAGIAYASEADEAEENELNIQVVAVDLSQEQSDAASAEEDSQDETQPETEAFDLAKTERPEATEDVAAGTNKAEETGVDKNWNIFYDEKNDVYQVTFNIGENAENIQVIDLTQALELLGQYAVSGRNELQDAIDELTKPVKGDAGDMPVAPDEPEKPAGFDQTAPEVPEAPVEPGKPEGLDDAVQGVWDKVFDLFSSDEGNKYNNTDNVLMELEAAGVDTGSQYAKDYAKYLVDKADNAFLLQVFETRGEVGGVGMFKYFMQWESSYNGRGEPTGEQIAQAIASVQRQDNRLEAPEYKVDKTSEAYTAYEAAKTKYEGALAQYELDKAAYDAAFEAYMAEHGPESEEGKAYAEAVAKYEALLVVYEAAMAEYNAKLAEIEAKYADDQAAYDAKVAELKAEYDRRIEANVLQPGDVKKFELFITSDSKHTYKYQSGSFTLATPGWGEQSGDVVGFDGQILPDEYVDMAKYHVTFTAKPMQDLFDKIGMTDPDNPLNERNILGNGKVGLSYNGNGDVVGYPGYWDKEISAFLANYEGETLADKLNAYLLDYYNSQDGTEYETIEELVQNNSSARIELTKTETSGNKWFKLEGQYFEVQAHTATVQYDAFYKNLFSFAFGSEADVNEILRGAEFNEATNRWEYGNDSWTANGYQNALYYYMDHQEIWQQTDAYFQALLDGGLSAEQATWTSLMMALNIDGELTGNDWQNTKWPWYSSIQLDRVDIDFSLTKTDGETGETITSSETEFQVYYIDKVTAEDGTVTNVNMYCTKAENGDYTFVTTPSTVWTESGELNISYAMMKDIVYYLQEMTAPEGYERDTNIYIVMSEDDYNKLSDEDKAALEGTFDKFLDLVKSEDGLTVSTDFVNVKIVTPPSTPDNPPPPPPETPETPEDPDDPPPPEIPDEPEDPEEPPVEPPVEVMDEDVPLSSAPEKDEEQPEDEELVDIPEEDVPLADVPKTGDEAGVWYALTILALGGLVVLRTFGKKRETSN